MASSLSPMVRQRLVCSDKSYGSPKACLFRQELRAYFLIQLVADGRMCLTSEGQLAPSVSEIAIG